MKSKQQVLQIIRMDGKAYLSFRDENGKLHQQIWDKDSLVNGLFDCIQIRLKPKQIKKNEEYLLRGKHATGTKSNLFRNGKSGLGASKNGLESRKSA